MPRLLVQPVQSPYRFLNPDLPGGHPVRDVPGLRLRAEIAIGRDAQPDDRRPHLAILDTGAPISVFPYHFWVEYHANVQWLYRALPRTGEPFVGHSIGPHLLPADFPAVENLFAVLMRPARILGGTSPALVGRIWVGVRDRLDHVLPAVPVTAQFLCDPDSHLKEPVLGMNAGILESRRLIRDTMAGKNRHAERLRHPGDSGPDHDQVWHLSQP